MARRSRDTQSAVSPAARVFTNLEADEALLPGQVSALRRSGALFLALLVLGAVPLMLAANAAGLIGDLPVAVAKGSNSGPGGGDEDDSSGPGGGDDDDDDTGTRLGTDDTSADGNSTRGTTNDNDTRTQRGTDDTSANGQSTRGTTNDEDTRTRRGTNETSANGDSTRGTTDDNDTRTGTGADTGTRTRTGGS